MENLLEQFIHEECTVPISNMLNEDIRCLQNSDITFKEYTFNRFNLYLDFSNKKARIEDDLDPSESGVLEIGLEVLLKSITQKNQ